MSLRFQFLALLPCLTATTLQAAWRDDIGYTRLQQLAGPTLPGAPSQGLTQTEALVDGNYAPNTASSVFAGKTFYLKSGILGISGHANQVATNFYSSTSQIPGTTDVDVYSADGWINASFLNLGTINLPLVESRAVQNHSWIGNELADPLPTEANQRLDYAIHRDGFVCVVGENNGTSTTLPQLFGQGYHTISVGLSNGAHSAGFSTFDIIGRIKPDIVAPDSLTSYATPMVAGTAGLLVAKLEAAPYNLTGPDKPRVVKALLLASASKTTVASWSNTSSRPLDLRYGAGELNAWHAYSTLTSGRVAASNNTPHSPCAWAAEPVAANSTQTYFFTIPAGVPSTPFCAALIWHRNVTTEQKRWSPRTWSASLDNLNLRLYQASGFTRGTLIVESLSAVDNVEMVYQPALVPGDYALVVDNPSGNSTSYGLAWHSLPAVTVTASTPVAREIDDQAGVITLIRTGDTTLPLYVPLTIGGSATPGTHYQALPTSATIPAGLTTTTLQITPVSDFIAQGDRTVTVAVAPDFTLVRDPAQTAVVTIQDKPFDAWRMERFSPDELDNPAISGETADPDADQIANLIEYALGLAPKSPDILPVNRIDRDSYLALSATKSPGATDITWSAECCAGLTSWDPAVTTVNSSSNFEARDTVLKTAATRRFIRLKITRP
jgi:hypothetical protein